MLLYELFDLFESNRGIIGVVLDNQSGRGKSFTKPDGTIVNATNAYKFPLDPTIKRYEPKPLQPEAPDDDIEDVSPEGNIEDLSPEEQFAAELQQELKMNVDNIEWVSGQKPSTGFAALVVELTSEKGRVWVGKYFSKKDQAGHLFWQVTKFVQDMKTIGIDLEEKRAAGATGVSGTVNLGPREVGVTDRVINLNNLVAEVQRGVANQDKIPPAEKLAVTELLENLGGSSVTINPEYKANYEVQFGEVAAPLAITRGINVTGSVTDAENILLNYLDPGTKFMNIQQVEFPENIAEKLIDSYLITPNGSKVGISSKDKKGGAAAAISGIIETMNSKMAQIQERIPTFQTRFKKYIDLLKIMENSSGKSVAFNVAETLGLITPEVAKQAFDAMVAGPGNEASLKAIDGGKYYNLTIGYPGYSPRPHPMYQIHYHGVASLARMVAETFNKDKKEVKEFFGAVLESSNMIQVMTKLGVKNDQAEFSNFTVIYPPTFDGDILLEAGSYFYATKPPAGFTFKIK
tara:strand:- start:40 stop:1593 length:1554 start_codon:yes stop_codon:yes gene_type:complete